MGYNIVDIEGIAKTNKAKLGKAGITTTDGLLKACATPKGRRETAAATGLSEKQILKWTNLADLMRIRGVATQYSELLEAAGVDTVKELRHRKPENLAEAMAQTNAKKKLTRQAPSAKTVARWVEQAKALKPMMRY
jgi:predicted RecB family nuclease